MLIFATSFGPHGLDSWANGSQFTALGHGRCPVWESLFAGCPTPLHDNGPRMVGAVRLTIISAGLGDALPSLGDANRLGIPRKA